ncbi:PLDc N-terminal domain-containing protein [Candidatus Woesearchaeota archaeon]|nr:PLDc N-terminal domain-containing protein [Candidatus Woesearchaeota archaeon]
MFAMMLQDNAGFAVFMILLMLLLFAVGIALLVFWVMMIVDCAKRKNLSDNERVVWILVLVFLQALGALIYYFAVKKK